MRFSSVRLGTLSGRVTVKGSISCYNTGTRYGCYGAGRERDVSQDARWRSACTELVRGARASVIRLRVSIAMFRFGCLYSELRLRSSMTKCLVRSIADEEKRRSTLTSTSF